MFFSPFSIAITSLGEERANLSAFRMFVQFVLVWFCRFPLPLGVWEGLQFVIMVLPGLFSYLFFTYGLRICMCFLGNPEIILFYILYIFNLDIFRASVLWNSTGGRYMYLVSTTP